MCARCNEVAVEPVIAAADVLPECEWPCVAVDPPVPPDAAAHRTNLLLVVIALSRVQPLGTADPLNQAHIPAGISVAAAPDGDTGI